MGRPFRRQSERRQIARPSYGGEREPDSHPTPGPPTLVQSARVHPPGVQGRAPRSSPGVVRSPGRLRRVQLAGRPLEDDVSAGAWIAEALNGRPPGTVAAFVPAGFAAFGRVLHPAVRYAGDEDVEVPWSEVADANAAVAHPLMQWPAITGGWEFVAE